MSELNSHLKIAWHPLSVFRTMARLMSVSSIIFGLATADGVVDDERSRSSVIFFQKYQLLTFACDACSDERIESMVFS